MDGLQLLIDLHGDGPRQGPGGDDETRLALALSGLTRASDLKIADIGCGTGASTLVLARELDAHVTAVDFVPRFLARLEDAARRAGLSDRVTTLAASMDALPFAESFFFNDTATTEIYTMGFAAGIAAWRRYLKPGGVLAISELTWLTERRAEELQTHWEREYPEVGTASSKIATLERLGFSPLGYFPLPERCWLDNYYRPLQQRFSRFLERHEGSAEALALVAAEERGRALYERHTAFVSYGFYVARKTAE
jgi:SAM-dependent methyltransferase